MAPPLAPLARQRWAVVAPIVERLAPRRILEIGCGMGAFGARLAARAEYTGVEQDAQACATARGRIEPAGGRVVQGSYDRVDGGGYDLVCAFEVLEHIEDDSAALAEWAALIGPAGSLLLSVPSDPDRIGAWDRAVGHYRRYSAGQLEARLAAAGLKPVDVVGYGWPLGYITETVRNRIAARQVQPDGRESMAARTSSSGRRLQPGAIAGAATAVAVAPFTALQRLRPDRGVGLVAVAAKPA